MICIELKFIRYQIFSIQIMIEIIIYLKSEFLSCEHIFGLYKK